MEITWLIILIAVIVYTIFRGKSRKKTLYSDDAAGELQYNKEVGENIHLSSPLVYYGENLDFSDEVIRKVLIKYFPYFNRLLPPDQDKFLSRLRKFIKTKIFIIHDVKGYREMPILISASSIQLTFGLDKFLMPHFNIIQIYPQEFIALEPMRILIGNVSGNTINIAWKQFLEGYKNRFDSSNVGLHEMAHALYYQNFETEEYIDRNFKNCFQVFTALGDRIYSKEKERSIGLYSDYAMKNFQEFWAESIELFFENPQRLNSHYPELYNILCDLLCQDPLRYPYHDYSV
ncbi:zinc-dependent peptidase [Pollutibacter soli]|uniref:zinc-dependent peptidase n=1 Tax=Pollutibacter soli TaxID=3034157 RepID=UPI003013509A